MMLIDFQIVKLMSSAGGCTYPVAHSHCLDALIHMKSSNSYSTGQFIGINVQYLHKERRKGTAHHHG